MIRVFLFLVLSRGLPMINNKKFFALIGIFTIVVWCEVNAMQVKRDSMLQTVSIFSAATASYFVTKALECIAQNECVGLRGTYVVVATLSAAVSAASLYRYAYPGVSSERLTKECLRDTVRALMCAASATRVRL